MILSPRVQDNYAPVKNTVFYCKTLKITPKGYMGPPLGWDETHMFAKHACFYVFLAEWLEGGPWEGGKGGGIINPPPEGV